MTLRFEQPQWLLLLILAVPMAVAALRWFTAMSLMRRWSAVLMRTLLIALIAGTLAGATAIRHTDRLAVVALVDVSGSVQRFASLGRDEDGRPISALEGVRRFLLEASHDRGPDDLLGLVVFDGAALAIASPTRVDMLDRPLDISMVEGTDISQAIRLGAAMIPSDAAGRLVLFSDGNQTAGDGLVAAREAVGGRIASAGPPSPGQGATGPVRAGLPIDVAPLAYNVASEVMIESIDAPPQAPAESVITVRVVLESAAAARGTLQLLREGQPLDINGSEPGTGRSLTLAPGRHVELINVPLNAGRIHRFEAVFEPDLQRRADGTLTPVGDTIASNNRAQAVTLTPGRGSVLVVDGVSEGDPSGPGQILPRTLREAALDVDVVSPAGVPGDLLSLQGYDLVILANVPADDLPRPVHTALASYVSELGGGLVMIGGKSSFGAGAWKGTDLEPILPVKLDLPEKLIVPAAAIMLVLDNSGSMNRTVMGSTRTQQSIANDGAALAVMTLDKTDMVGVISFNLDYTVEVPLSRNSDPKATAAKIRSITSDGGTNIPPALDAAYRQLKGVTADVRHIILLTDGRSQGTELLADLAAKIHDDGISVSTIGVGDQADTRTLADMAARGGGQFYQVSDPTILPRIFLKAVRVLRTPLVREAPFTPVLLGTGSPLVEGLGSIGDGSIPPLGGLVLTQARTEPGITYAMIHPAGEPLLAHWNVGLGRVAAFTSDASRWAREWIDWPGYRQMWTQVARTISRPPTDRSQELTLEIVGDALRIRLDAADKEGKPLDLLSVPASVYTPSGERVALNLSQTGPGVYEGNAPAPSTGNYVVTLTPRLGNRPLSPVIGGTSRATGVEYRRLTSNVGLLEEISRATGGRVFDIRNGKGVKLFDRTGITPSEARLPLWRTLALWALAALLLDIGTRRVAWDRLLSREFGAALRRETAEAMRDRGAQSARTLSSLREREKGGEVVVAQAAEVKTPERPQMLSTEDARRIVREQAERRRMARAAGAASPAGGAGPAPQPAPQPASRPPSRSPPVPRAAPAGDEQTPPVEPEQTTSGLLAAKRRARERIEGQEEQGNTG